MLPPGCGGLPGLRSLAAGRARSARGDSQVGRRPGYRADDADRAGVFRRDHRAADRSGHDVRHFALLADPRVIEGQLRQRAVVHAIQRLRGQQVPLFRETFAMRKLGLCLSRLSQPEFAIQLRTDQLTVAQVAEAIAASAGLELGRRRGTAVGDRLRWAGRGLRHALTR